MAPHWLDPQAPLKGAPGDQKHAAWSSPDELDHTKLIGNDFGGTVNNILLTAVAGALPEYLRSLQEPVEGLDLRGFIAVNLRPVVLGKELGNKFGLVFLSLPLGIEGLFERYLELKRRVDRLKSSYEAAAGYSILGIMGYQPLRLQDVLRSVFDAKDTAVMTNIPGPWQTLYLPGAPRRCSPTAVRRLNMSESLETALHDLDKFLKNASPPPSSNKSMSSSPERCQAQTKSGGQCKNRAFPGKTLCRAHTR